MGRRRGEGQILSADELAEKLAVPCYYILKGRAQASFPYTSTPGPSPFVKVVPVRPLLGADDAVFFTTTVNWRQWNSIVAPVLEDVRASRWGGSLGGASTNLNGGIPNNPLGAALYPGSDLIGVIRELLRLRAIQEGYGNPEQEPLPEGSC